MKIGVIGGSGLYAMDGLGDLEELVVATPFGAPSDVYTKGHLGGHEVFFLPRHGVGHRLMPSEINHRANIYGMKQLGMDLVISVSAVGSLREDFRPRDVILPDQYYDRTKQSQAHTFFGGGMVAHIGFGEPTCAALREQIAQATQKILVQAEDVQDKPSLHVGGTYVCMEGPAFSTRAESNIYRKLGCDLIGMTSLPEAKLCREAGLCYQAIAMITDYDCWHTETESVTVEMVTEHMKANALLAQAILREVIGPDLKLDKSCPCRHALTAAVATAADQIPAAKREQLAVLLGRPAQQG